MKSLKKRLMRALTGSAEERNLDDLLDRSDRLLEAAAEEPRRAGSDSAPRHTFAGGNPMDLMSLGQSLRYFPAAIAEIGSFFASMREIKRRSKAWRHGAEGRGMAARTGLPSGRRAASRAAAVAEAPGILLKELARIGAANWGMAEIPGAAVFAGKVAPFPRAIVFTGSMDYGVISRAPDFSVLPEVARAYGSVGAMANRLSRKLNGRGIRALPGHPLGGAVNYPLMGQLAGLGWVGRSGMLISPVDGPCQRIGLVYVDLPEVFLAGQADHSWVGDFCDACGACARRCPVGAIPGGTRGPEGRASEGVEGPGPRGTDGDLCLPYFHAQWGCSACIAACPFARVGYAKVREGFLGGREASAGSSAT